MQKNEPKTELLMSLLTPIQTNGAAAKLKRSLKNSRLKLDEAPRFLQVMANSPASLRAYLRADAALARGQLTPRQRQQVALAVAEINGSSLSAHFYTGRSLGLTHQEVQLARNAAATDPKADTMLRFTRSVVLQRGDISDEDFQALGKAGFTDAQTIEIVANIALNIFSNYFSSVAKTEVDFPLLQPGADAPRIGIAQSKTRPATLRVRPKPQLNGK
jgi:AhpD family alkylhydroperoxidase